MAVNDKWDREVVIHQVLKPLFQLGYSVLKACRYAGIPPTTVQHWIETSDELRLQIAVWQNEINIKARKNIAVEILGESAPEEWRDKKVTNILPSHTWLRSREKEDWTERTENMNVEITYDDLLKMQEENLEKANKIEEERTPKPGLYDKLN